MATYAQTPGLLNIKGVVGTHFSCQLDFGTNLSAYTFDAAIVLQEYPSQIEQAITVTVDNAAQGIITLSLTQGQTTAIKAISNKKWYLNWTTGGIKFTILAGRFELSEIPLGQNIVTSTGITINTQDVDITLSAFSNAALDGKQPLDADLTAIAALTPNDDDILQRKSGSWTNRSIAQYKTDLALNNVDNTSDVNKPLSNATINALSYKVNTNQISTFGYNLIDDADASEARTTLGLGTLSEQNSNTVNITGGTAVLTTPLGLSSGGTNANLSPTNGGVVYSTATNFAVSSAGSSGQFLRSNGTGAPSWETPSTTAGNATIFDNNSANREFFPVFAYQSNGTATTLYGSSQKLKFNPSNGYFYADGGFSCGPFGDSKLTGSGVAFANQIIFNAEENKILDINNAEVANWGSGNGLMYVRGAADKDLPLQLVDSNADAISTGAYIIVRPEPSATANGANLRVAYTYAKAFTPNTAALSATNRATVILLPGRYDLGTTRLNLDTDFVDIIGLTDTPEQVVITSAVVLSDSGTVYQTANDVKIKGVTIDRTGTPQGSGAGRTAAYFPFPKATAITTWSGDGTTMTIAANGHGLQNGDSVRISGSGNSSVDGVFTVTRIDDNSFSYPSTVNAAGSIGTATERFNLTNIENCVFSGDNSSGMRLITEYSGTYRRCVGGAGSFSGVITGSGANASGLFEDCTATSGSFGGSNGSASGTFTRCSASSASFGSTASGVFTDCTAEATSFGGQAGGSASGTFLRCTVNGAGFGSSSSGGNATGTFTDCTLTNTLSYGGTFTGTMRRCRFVCTGTNNNALRVGDGAKIFDSTLVATGTGNSITAGSAVTISLAGCRMNNNINANVSNNLGTLTESYNLIDSDIN
jgi:hypothetical protein